MTLPTDMRELQLLNADYVRSVQACDAARFEELLAADFLNTGPDGALMDRAAFLDQISRPPGISKLEARDVLIRIFGDIAIVHARTVFQKPDGTAGHGRYTDIWHRRNGRWLAVAAHVTRGGTSPT